MQKYFNTTGVCVTHKHYMVDIQDKLAQINRLIDREQYFVINRPRQYGKTTTLSLLEKSLCDKYLVISISFEGIGESIFQCEKTFSNKFISLLEDQLEFSCEEAADRIRKLHQGVEGIDDLSRVITKFVRGSSKPCLLIIDEVDKSSNNEIFLSFLGMLRQKFLFRNMGKDFTFSTVILAGVHDVKTLKLKLRANEEKKYNSPWNIAVDFNVDMSFGPRAIKGMLQEYEKDYALKMPIEKLAEKIYFYTAGYPFLVSKICEIIDEEIYLEDKKAWNIKDIEWAVKRLVRSSNTLFEDLIKNLENNNDLYELVKGILIEGIKISFVYSNPILELGSIFGILKNTEGSVAIQNKIFEQYIYDYMISKIEVSHLMMGEYNFKRNFINEDKSLNMKKILLKFQQFMKEQHSQIDEKFIEREGRLLFLAFIKPIINGVGFDFKEVQIAEEKRLDVVVTYHNFKYIIELKVWRGETYHAKGISQLGQYLDINQENKGYLVVFNFNKNKEYKDEQIVIEDKEIMIVYV